MKKILTLLILLVLSPLGLTAQQRRTIVGTWDLLSYEDTADKGSTVYPWGKHPSGILIYDDSGHMAVQIQRTPVERSIAKSEEKLTPTDKVSLLRAYTAYFGTYSLDWERMTVTHHVAGNLFPVYIGTDQEKNFELDGDRYTLKVSWIDDGKHWSGVRVFERMRPTKH